MWIQPQLISWNEVCTPCVLVVWEPMSYCSFCYNEWIEWGKKKKKTCLFWDERNLLLSSLDKLKNNYTAIDVETYLIRKMWSHTSKSIKNIKIVLIPACNFTTHFPLQQACIGLLLLKNCRSSLHLTSILYYYNATIKDYCWDH